MSPPDASTAGELQSPKADHNAPLSAVVAMNELKQAVHSDGSQARGADLPSGSEGHSTNRLSYQHVEQLLRQTTYGASLLSTSASCVLHDGPPRQPERYTSVCTKSQS